MTGVQTCALPIYVLLNYSLFVSSLLELVYFRLTGHVHVSWLLVYLDRMVINAHYTCVQATFRIKARTSGGRDPWYLFSKDLEANFLELVDSPLSTYSTGSKGDAVVIALASHQCDPVQIQASTPYVG